MKHVELHAHYLRQLAQEKGVTLVYCKINDQIVDIFKNSLSKAKFGKLHDMLKVKASTIMGGCPIDVISPPKSLEHCVDGSSHPQIYWRQLFDQSTSREVDYVVG